MRRATRLGGLVLAAALATPAGVPAVPLVVASGAMPQAKPDRPFPQHVQLPARARRPAVPQRRLDAATWRLWRSWRERYLRTEGGDGTWVEHDPSPTTVSEGIGYGMIFAAYFGDRAAFDGLWRYSRAHPSRFAPDLMAWKQALRNGRMVDVAGRDAATDGDLDIAYALLLAHRQWGSGGPVDYARAARVVTRAILRHMVNDRLWSTTPGDWAALYGGDSRYTRTSDFMPAHFLAFARTDPARRTHWLRVYRATAGIVAGQFRRGSRATGLLPDFMVHSRGRWRPVPGRYLESRHDGDFFWNACRTPWRLSMAYLAAGRQRLLPVTTTFTRWLRRETGGRPGRMVAGYFVRNGSNGAPFRGYYDLAFGAAAAVAAMTSGRQRWLDRSWRRLLLQPDVTDYYGDSLRLMALLVLSRNWWQP